jgi:hypothetical protein
MGDNAGESGQKSQSVAIGYECGKTSQGPSSVAIGYQCGMLGQNTSSVAFGNEAGRNAQRSESVALGYKAGRDNQSTQSVAVGYQAGKTSQGTSSVAVGLEAGETTQGVDSVAIGFRSGQTNQGAYSVAVGYQAGQATQGLRTTAVGFNAGNTAQGDETVAVGHKAGETSQGIWAVAIGSFAGRTNQGCHSIAMGYTAGITNQGYYAIALGREAGLTSQGSSSIALGFSAGESNQGRFSTAVGASAGQTNQGPYNVAVGRSAGETNQENYTIAVGYNAGQSNQGAFAVALGYFAGRENQHNNTIAINALGYSTLQTTAASAFFVKPLRSQTGTAMYYDTASGEISYSSSDDRLKVKEVRIKDATTTLMKLSPQSYFKKFKLDEPDISHYESGLMAQDVWYDAPELRHAVHLGAYADPTPEKPPAPSDNLEDDPDYSAWGSDPAQVQYDQLIPYTIKSIQEIVTELPRSKTTVSNVWGQNIVGCVVSANANAHKTTATPIVALSNVYMDKKWYGVVSNKTTDTNDYDTLVDTKGDTQIWVTDVGGPLESGDLVTTSNVAPGYTQKQGDGALMNYTVAKVTQDCDFTEPTRRPIRVPKREMSNVVYYIQKTEVIADLYEYEQNLCERRKTKKTKTVYRKIHEEGLDTMYFDAGGNEVSKRKYETLAENERSKLTYSDELSIDDLTPEEQSEYTETQKTVYYRVDIVESPVEIEEGAYDETEIRQELVGVLDENGQIVWEETGETEPVYTLVDHGNYKAALMSAKLV